MLSSNGHLSFINHFLHKWHNLSSTTSGLKDTKIELQIPWFYPKKFMFSNHQIKIILSTALHIKFKFPSGWLQWPHWLHQPWWPLQPRLPQQPPWTQKYQKCKRFRYWVVFLASATWTASICGIDHWKPNIAVIFGNLSFRGCGGQPLSLLWNIRVKSQMPAATEHDFKEKSTKLLILLPLRTIYFRTCQCETPCSNYYNEKKYNNHYEHNFEGKAKIRVFLALISKWLLTNKIPITFFNSSILEVWWGYWISYWAWRN